MDFKANPFGPMAELLNMANSITRLRALCIVCNKPASHTFKKTSSSQIIEIGETDIYEARCFDCFEKGYKNSVLTND